MNNTFRIHVGHWIEVAKDMPDNSVHVCVTSPPYYGLRSYNSPPQIWMPSEFGYPIGGCQGEHEWEAVKQYKDSWRRGERSAGFFSDNGKNDLYEIAVNGEHHSALVKEATAVGANRTRSREELRDGRWTCTDICAHCGAWKGELGQEPDPAMYVDHLVQCFAEVHRILRPDGLLFVNLGDAYYNYRPGKHDDARAQGFNRERDGSARDIPSFTPKRGMQLDGYKEKDLMDLPWEFAIAMRKWGWYRRSTIVWHKPNPLSESVDDRPTQSWEPIFMFSKSEKYYYDKWAVSELPTGNAHPRSRVVKVDDVEISILSDSAKPLSSESRNNGSYRNATQGMLTPGGRNRRNVWTGEDFWTINVEGYADKHYAAFAEKVPELCIRAGSSEVGCCPECATPWKRIVLKAAKPLHASETLESRYRRAAVEYGIRDIDKCLTGDSITLGWKMTCRCKYATPVPCTVLDPFAGRGTTGAVAVRFGRNVELCDLTDNYVPMIRKNLMAEAPLWVKEIK